MRVTFNMMSLKYIKNLQDSLAKLSDANDKVTQGKNLITPESDVTAYASAINIQRTIDEGQQFSKNAQTVVNWVTNYDNELQRAYDLITTAKNQYAISGANDSQNATSRKALAGEVSNALQSLVSVGNANYFGRYFFSGYKTDTKAFAADSREVSSVKISGGITDADVIKRGVFADLPELKEGNYSVSVTKQGDYVSISLFDAMGKKVIIDSNGADESAKNGNYAGTTLNVRYNPGEVVNLGVGVAVKLPSSFGVNNSFSASFYFKPGDDIRYQGDDGIINTKIGYQQEVPLNFTGKEVFTEVERILKGTRLNTVKGLAVTEPTKFSDIDGANISPADYIEISGTDHNGLKVGTARISGIDNVTLDMTNSSKDQRTLKITYAGKTKEITLDPRSYKDMEDVIFSLNRELETAGLGRDIEAISDGDKVMFATTKSGNGVSLKIDTTDKNTFGLAPSNTAMGKDTTFELGFDNYSTDPLSVTFSSINSSDPFSIYIDNNYITIPASAGRTMSGLIGEIKNEIEKLGLDSNYNVKSSDITTNSIVFEKMNIDFTNNSALAVKLNNSYKTDNARTSDYPHYSDKRISDLLTFIENLYDNTVDARLDNGYISVVDKRGGTSRLSINLKPSNTGIGYPEIDQSAILKGKYAGAFDATWNVAISAPVSGQTTITVKDGQNVIKSITVNTNSYHGEDIDLGYGVKMVLPDFSSHAFNINLKSATSLSFGDMNIVQDGKNVDTFRSLKNLYDALNLNIPQEGIGAPSAWGNTDFKSTVNPYLDGTFRGNYNDEWKYEITSSGQQTSFYLQNELATSGVNNIGINSSVQLNFDVVFSNSTGSTDKVSFTNLNVTSAQDLIDAINNDPVLSQNNIKAEITNNKITLKSGSGLQEVEINPQDQQTADAIGFSVLYDNDGNPSTLDAASDYRSVFSKSVVNLNLANTTDAQRTLTFKYFDGSSWNQSSIKLESKNYANLDEMITAINNNPSLPAGINATKINNQLVFQYSGSIANLLVEGDHEGTIGFLKYGDEMKVKITNSKGELVNELKFDTANQTKTVADGVKLAFDKGTAYTTDFFTSTVGSGINYEIEILDTAENQINEKLTIAGTRQNRAESVTTFQDTIKTSSENIKAKFLGSTPQDVTEAMSRFQMALQAYQAALATSTKVMQLSILNYI